MPFLIFGKEMSNKIAPATLRFVSMFFSIFAKRGNKKIEPGILIFVSSLF